MPQGFVGYGELGRQVAALLAAQGGADEQRYFDDVAYRAGRPGAAPFDAYADEAFAGYDFYVALGYKHLTRKAEIVGRLLSKGRRLPVLVAESSHVSRSAELEPGVVVFPMCAVDEAVQIGMGTLVNNGVTLSHNNKVGACCYLSPGVITCGFVVIGDQTFLGAGSVVSNNVTIGANVRIGIGTVVTRDISDGASVIGNPMRVLSRCLELT
jgi:sugar O-acyltransferase (sialic acid O-acetyltransferase NeuD family)